MNKRLILSLAVLISLAQAGQAQQWYALAERPSASVATDAPSAQTIPSPLALSTAAELKASEPYADGAVLRADDEIEYRFSHNGDRWRFTRSKKTRAISMYRTDRQGNTTRRQLLLSKNEWNAFFDPGFSLGTLPSNNIFFTNRTNEVTNAMIYSICISWSEDHIYVYRNLPRRGVSEPTIPVILKFSVQDTLATRLSVPGGFVMIPGTNVIQHDSLLIRSIITERGLSMWIYSVNSGELKNKIQLTAGDSISNRIVVRKSISRLLYSRDLQKDYKNPYGRFVSTFGNSIISSFAFINDSGDLVFGLTRYIEERSNTGLMGVTVKSGEKYFTLSLRLNPATLEPYDDPNGPVLPDDKQ